MQEGRSDRAGGTSLRRKLWLAVALSLVATASSGGLATSDNEAIAVAQDSVRTTSFASRGSLAATPRGRVLRGDGRDNVLRGGPGADRIFGGAGRDDLNGGAGADLVRGGPGTDRLVGGAGADRLLGDGGADRVLAFDGQRDRIDCGPGRDVVIADSNDRARRCELIRRRPADRKPAAAPFPEPAPGVVEPPSRGEPPGGGSGESGSGRPNIILIVTDDQRYDTVTPQLMPNTWSLLVERGVTFERSFVTRSLCCPSRASTLTGQYAHNHGVLTNWAPNGGFEYFDDSATVATWLRSAGYRTGLVGKYLNGFGEAGNALYAPPGWDTFRAFVKPDYYNYSLSVDGRELRDYRGRDPVEYSTTVVAREALDFIGRAATDERPFFLDFSPFAPHTPATPTPGHENDFAGTEPHRPPSFNEQDVTDKPAWVREQEPLGEREVDRLDELRLDMLRSTVGVDLAVRDMVKALADLGELDNTYIFFTSDNGYLWGEHRVRKKRSAYQESMRVPLVARGPGIAAARDDRIVANIDLAPTFAELAGATPTLPVDGRSLAPILTGQPLTWRSDILIEHWVDSHNPELPTYRGIYAEVDGSPYKYVEYDGPGGFGAEGDRELYELAADTDPYEEDSVANGSRSDDLVERLAARLSELASCSGATCR